MEVHALAKRGWTISAITRHTGFDGKMVRYAAVTVMPRRRFLTGGQCRTASDDVGMLIGGWFPELSDPAARASTWPLIAPHQDRIKAWLDADVTVATIAQWLRDDHGVAASE